MFEDDVILFLSNLLRYLSLIFKLITTFCKLSGYKINITKSEILELDPQLPGSFWAQIGQNSQNITYFGIKIGKTPESLYRLSYTDLLIKLWEN